MMPNKLPQLNSEFLLFVQQRSDYEKIWLWDWIIGLTNNKDYTPDLSMILNIPNPNRRNEVMLLFAQTCKLLKFKNVWSNTVDNSHLIKEVITYLNMVLGSAFRADSKPTIKLINGLVAQGYTIEDMKTVIDKKGAGWSGDPKMCKYLRPITLFSEKFESYLNEPEPSIEPTRENATDRAIQKSIADLSRRNRTSDN